MSSCCANLLRMVNENVASLLPQFLLGFDARTCPVCLTVGYNNCWESVLHALIHHVLAGSKDEIDVVAAHGMTPFLVKLITETKYPAKLQEYMSPAKGSIETIELFHYMNFFRREIMMAESKGKKFDVNFMQTINSMIKDY